MSEGTPLVSPNHHRVDAGRNQILKPSLSST